MPRPLRLDLEHLTQLKLPCVLHWDFNHFVVLTRASASRSTILQAGQRDIPCPNSPATSPGVALEPGALPDRVPATHREATGLHHETHRTPAGPGGAAAQVLAARAGAATVHADRALHAVGGRSGPGSQDRDLVTVLGAAFLLLALIQAGVTAPACLGPAMVLGTTQPATAVQSLSPSHPPADGVVRKAPHGETSSALRVGERDPAHLTNGVLEALIDGVMVLLTLA